MEPPLPPVIAHRGACQVAPENTLAAVRAAKTLGGTWIEIDAMLSKDGYCVVHHDNNLERCTNGQGQVSQYKFRDLEELDAGSHFSDHFAGEKIPLLSSVLQTCAKLNLGVNIEVKHANDDAIKEPNAEEIAAEKELAEAVCRVVQDLDSEIDKSQVLISSFSQHALEVCHEMLPQIPRSYLVEGLPADWQAVISRYECCSLNIWHEHEDYSRDSVIQLSQQVPVYAYTVNSLERAEELKEWGVKGVFSDCVDKVIPAFDGQG